MVLAGAVAVPTMVPQTVQAAPGAVTMAFVPVRASGIQCASPGQDPATCDWFLAGGNQIILNRGDQDVAIEMRLSDWDPLQLGILIAAYQGTLDCATFTDPVSGLKLTPLALTCADAPGGFNDFCIGVDTMRPDYILSCCPDIGVCNNNNTCPNGLAEHFACGGVSLNSGAADSGSPAYGATFAVHVPLGMASYQLGIDPDPSQTLVRDQVGETVAPIDLQAATITIRCASSADCDDGIPCTQDICSTLFGICQNPLQADACLIGGLCAAQGDDNPTNDCEFCDPPTAQDAWSLRPSGDACGTLGAGTCLSLDVCDGAGVCLLGEVSLFDFSELAGCMTGPGPAPLTPCCSTFDTTPDSDVDLADFAEFQIIFTGL